MNLERKVVLMKESYLHGYAAELVGIDAIIKIFESEGISQEEGEELISGLYENYCRVQNHYDNVVPFYEITQEIEATDWGDFVILFRVREVLPKFKAFIDEYVAYLRANNYHTPKGCEILEKFDVIHAELFEAENYNGMNLKKRIEKYDPNFKSEPAQSK